MQHKTIAKEIFLAGVESVLPERLITQNLTLKDDCLYVRDLCFPLNEKQNIYVVGAGKASALMAAGVERILKRRITYGQIIVKYGHKCKLEYIEVTEAGHPLPDLKGVEATDKILEILGKAGEKDLVLCLLSGGGSALLVDYPDNTDLNDIIFLNDLLIKSGATINEINIVRKHLSRVKGGGLSGIAYPATVVSLILSDVIGDPVDSIASGPTAADPSTFDDALNILTKYNLTGKAPAGVIKHLHEGKKGKIRETPKSGDSALSKTHNYIIGNNNLALETAAKKAAEFNTPPVIITDRLQGDTENACDFIVNTIMEVKRDGSLKKPLCLLFGGETTVKVRAGGKGGRNQHLALLCSVKIAGIPGITILCGGTDGTDGPTDSAGAVVDSFTIAKADSNQLDVDGYIGDFNSYEFFRQTGDHIFTGPTMTNVMDIVVAIIE